MVLLLLLPSLTLFEITSWLILLQSLKVYSIGHRIRLHLNTKELLASGNFEWNSYQDSSIIEAVLALAGVLTIKLLYRNCNRVCHCNLLSP